MDINQPLVFSTGMFKYGQFSGVKNYLVLVGSKKGVDVKVKDEHLVQCTKQSEQMFV